jgi:hypothetical protein
MEGKVGQQGRNQQRGENGDAGKGDRRPDPGREDIAQECGADADPDGEEGLMCTLERKDDVVVARGTEDRTHGGDDAGVLEQRVVFPLGECHIVLGWVRAQQSFAVAISDGDIKDGRCVTIDRAEEPVQPLVVLQNIQYGSAQRGGVVGIDLPAL